MTPLIYGCADMREDTVIVHAYLSDPGCDAPGGTIA